MTATDLANEVGTSRKTLFRIKSRFPEEAPEGFDDIEGWRAFISAHKIRCRTSARKAPPASAIDDTQEIKQPAPDTKRDTDTPAPGDIEFERRRLLKAQADRTEIDVAEKRETLMERQVVFELHERIFLEISQIIKASRLTHHEQADLLKKLRHGIKSAAQQ
jgi:phage terminase Nu1 subunit (DNA packaging protein)